MLTPLAIVIASAAFLTRYALMETDTLWQILVFSMIAMVFALLQDGRRVLPTWAVLAGAATIAILSAKLINEGNVFEH